MINKNINAHNIVFPNHTNLSKNECYELVKMYKNTSLPIEERFKARNRVVKHHLKFLIQVAKKFNRQHKNVPIEEFWEAGVEGLLVAFDKCDIERLKNIKFYTYASFWINAYMREYFIKYGSVIRYSANIHKNLHTEYKKITELYKELSPEKANIEWKKFKNKWGTVQDNIDNVNSLDEPLKENNLMTMHDTIADNKTNQDHSSTIDIKRLFAKIPNIITKELNFYEQKIISCLFEINTGKYSIQELSEELNITKEYVQTLRNKALKKIKENKEFKKMSSFYVV